MSFAYRFLGFAFVGTVLALSVLAQTPPPAPDLQQGIEVLTRGPIHEAFAEPSSSRQPPGLVINKKPPDPIPEVPPDQRPAGENVMWIPGYWAWDAERPDFLWVSGVWRAPPPQHQWVPGYWQQVESRWQWVSGYWTTPQVNTVDYYPPPPDPVAEAIPPPADADSTFIPGTWVYVEDQYRWRPGLWIGNQPGWIWSPASYYWTPRGYAFADGYWDHDLDHRGLAFAPVYVDPQYYGRANWSYRPAYALAADGILGSLFVNPTSHHYYFGDYFDAGDARRGFVPWTDHRIGKVADPLLSYYRWQNKNDARWETNLRNNYAARTSGKVSRPARTFALHEKAIAEKAPGASRLVAPLNRWEGNGVKLQVVPQAHAAEIQNTSQQWRTYTQARGRAEAPVRSAAPPVTQPPAVTQQPAPAPQRTRIEMPQQTIQHPVTVRTPPPAPVHPQPAPPRKK